MSQKPFVQHPWDERVGADASITNVSRGKRQINRDQKTVSQVPLPVEGGRSPFVVEVPRRLDRTSVAKADKDLQLWKSYREIINADDNRLEGKKMCVSHIEPTAKVQAKLRKCLRQKLREHDEREAELARQLQHERCEQLKRHAVYAEHQRQLALERAAERGFEGLARPHLRPAPRLPSVDRTAIERAASTSLGFERQSGKRMVREHPSQIDSGKPFGSLRAESEPLRRWEHKSFT